MRTLSQPCLVVPLPYLGGAYSSTNDFEKARDCFEKALRVNPQSVYANKNLGIAYGNLHQLDKALESFKRALDANPSDPELNQLVGMTYEKRGDTANARPYYRMARGLTGRNSQPSRPGHDGARCERKACLAPLTRYPEAHHGRTVPTYASIPRIMP
jgi:Tfp pilus assembly protein PilF